MKHLLLLSILVALLALNSLRCTAALPIYDTDGHEVTGGRPYHILPADRSHGGGFGPSYMDGSYPCPMRLIVTGGHDQTQLGTPVVIAPPNASAVHQPRLSAGVEISFHTRRVIVHCAEIAKELHLRGQDAVDMQWHMAAGRMDRLGPQPLSSKVFRVEWHGGAYKLASCARWPEDGRRCHDLGLHADAHGQRWLVVSDMPYAVVFHKFRA